LSTIGKFNENLLDWAEGVFDTYDEDKSGYLDFRELVICMSVLCKGSFEERMRLCFNVYDADKSGYLQFDEYEHLIKSILAPYKKLK